MALNYLPSIILKVNHFVLYTYLPPISFISTAGAIAHPQYNIAPPLACTFIAFVLTSKAYDVGEDIEDPAQAVLSLVKKSKVEQIQGILFKVLIIRKDIWAKAIHLSSTRRKIQPE